MGKNERKPGKQRWKRGRTTETEDPSTLVYAGQKPSLEIKPTMTEWNLKMRDIPNLVLWILSDEGDVSTQPKWVFVKAPGSKTTLYDSITSLLEQPMSKLKWKKRIKKKVKSEGGTGLGVSEEEMVPKKVEEDGFEKLPLHPLSLVLSAKEQHMNGYPVPSDWLTSKDGIEFIEGPTGSFKPHEIVEYKSEGDKVSIVDSDEYCCTKPHDSSTEEPRLFGLDCEMVRTKAGLELARVTLINQDLMVVLDHFVLPSHDIVDYVTAYSGITAESLAGVTRTWKEVREEVLDHVSWNDVLVGHSMENDLMALRLCHRRVLDTSVLYPHPRQGMKYALKKLSGKYLQRVIQNGEHGHDSIEDSTVALELAQMKLKKGSSFGAVAGPGANGVSLPIIQLLGEEGGRTRLIGRENVLNKHVTGSSDAIVCINDDEVIRKARKTGDYTFSFVHLDDIGQHWRKCEKDYSLATACGVETADKVEFGDESRFLELLKDADRHVGDLADSLTEGTLLMVVLGQPNKHEFNIQQRKRRFGKADGSWNTSDEACFKTLVQQCRNAVVYCTVIDKCDKESKASKEAIDDD